MLATQSASCACAECLAYCFLELYLGDLPWWHELASAQRAASQLRSTPTVANMSAAQRHHFVDRVIFKDFAAACGALALAHACVERGVPPA